MLGVFSSILFVQFLLQAQACTFDPETYYSRVNPAGEWHVFKQELHDLIKGHKVLPYDGLWDAFQKIDSGRFGCNTGALGDIYSSNCWESRNLQCGDYSREGDCYNREHTFPSSWFGGDKSSPAYSDLHHLYPSDGYVNSVRGNSPYGSVKTPEYTSSNECVHGVCLHDSGADCFLPNQHIRGDLARGILYFSIRYMNELNCCDGEANNQASLKPWFEELLRAWNKEDPVDDAERARTTGIYCDFQGNRNPFVDHPEWVDLITDF